MLWSWLNPRHVVCPETSYWYCRDSSSRCKTCGRWLRYWLTSPYVQGLFEFDLSVELYSWLVWSLLALHCALLARTVFYCRQSNLPPLAAEHLPSLPHKSRTHFLLTSILLSSCKLSENIWNITLSYYHSWALVSDVKKVKQSTCIAPCIVYKPP